MQRVSSQDRFWVLGIVFSCFSEAKAAKAAGAVANLIEREGNAELKQDIRKEFPVVSSFTDLPFNTKSKRKNEEAEVEVCSY